MCAICGYGALERMVRFVICQEIIQRSRTGRGFINAFKHLNDLLNLTICVNYLHAILRNCQPSRAEAEGLLN